MSSSQQINSAAPLLDNETQRKHEIMKREHEIFYILRSYAANLSEKEQHTEASDADVERWKKFLFYMALVLKPGSCTYGYVLYHHAVNLFADQRYINGTHFAPLPYINGVFSTLLMLCDMGNSIFSSKKAVRNIIIHPNWIEGLKENFKAIKTGELPPGLLLTGLLSTVGSGVKGYVGCDFVLTLLSTVSGLEQNKVLKSAVMALSMLVGADSAFCYYAFQVNDKGMRVVNERRELNKSADTWSEYQKNNRAMLFAINVAGFFIAIVSSIVTAMSVFYSKGSFDIELWPTVYFVVMAASSIVNNIWYTSNPVYKHWWIQNNHREHVQDCQDCPQHIGEEASRSKNSMLLKKVVGAINSLGVGVSYYPAIMQVMLAMYQEKDMEKIPDWTAGLGLVISVMMAMLVIPRVYTMTVRGQFFSPQPAAIPQNESSISRNISPHIAVSINGS